MDIRDGCSSPPTFSNGVLAKIETINRKTFLQIANQHIRYFFYCFRLPRNCQFRYAGPHGGIHDKKKGSQKILNRALYT